jgi:hypothetical protein
MGNVSTTAWHQVAPQVVREVFDDEVIIINMESGNYFSLNTTGAYVWSLIEAGFSVDGIVGRVSRDFEGADAFAAPSVQALLDQMLGEGLIVTGAGPAPSPSSVANPATKRAFEPPTLAVYTDMQELLLLDPIHDVDETGWPQRQDEPKV